MSLHRNIPMTESSRVTLYHQEEYPYLHIINISGYQSHDPSMPSDPLKS